MDASVNRIKSSADERAFLIGLKIKGTDEDVDVSLDELNLLVLTAGATIVDSDIVTREKIDPAYIIGTGYLARLKERVNIEKIRLIVFDLNQIRPAQIRNLEENLKCRVVGRTEIILDIFAQRARSAESQIQVELAQLKYILPRLKGLGEVLSRTGGGIGTRGPGETMLETDRRHILKRIQKLDEKLKKISGHRSRIRKSRSGEILGAVVGYTNAGKSTLINSLAHDDLFVEDRLFATLDAYTRMVFLDDRKKVLLTDTVGFIRNLPANLIESFNSTLEEIKNAHFLIHAIDITSPDIDKRIETVNRELAALDCGDKPALIFFNKSDRIKDENILAGFATRYRGAIIGSAVTGMGIPELKTRMMELHGAIGARVN